MSESCVASDVQEPRMCRGDAVRCFYVDNDVDRKFTIIVEYDDDGLAGEFEFPDNVGKKENKCYKIPDKFAGYHVWIRVKGVDRAGRGQDLKCEPESGCSARFRIRRRTRDRKVVVNYKGNYHDICEKR